MKTKSASKNRAASGTKKKPSSSAAKRSAKTSVKPSSVASAGRAKKSEKTRGKRAAKSAPVVLTTDERRKMLKPKDQFVPVVERVVRALAKRREIRVPGMTVGKLKTLTAKAVRAAKREALVREQFERKIRPLSDARLMAEDAAYRALLNVYAAVKLYARADPGVGSEFAFLIEHLTFAREKAEPAAAPERDTPPAPEPT